VEQLKNRQPQTRTRKIRRKKTETVDEYIERFPEPIRVQLEAMRKTIRRAAPNAVEEISYLMPAYRQDSIHVWFAGFKNHIGFYPGASGIAAFKKELSAYKSAKGSVQFPLEKPLPLVLVNRIVKYRLRESQKRTR
jgi:uncharacterized protein YdhG (YjbR/CyaY superfamily)